MDTLTASVFNCILVATLLASSHALAIDEASDVRAQRAQNGLLPRVTIKEDLGRTASIVERMQAFGIPGASIAVIDEGRVVWVRAFGLRDTADQTPVTNETLFQAGSISKPIAALGALRLVKDGKLSLDNDVNAKLTTWRVPDNEFTEQDKVTLRRLLNHTAGLTVHGFPGYSIDSRIPTVVQILNGEQPANTAPVRVDVHPGSRYRYSGGGYTVMQLLVTDVSGETFESFMQWKVLDALGMNSSSYSQDRSTPLASRRASAHRPGGERIPGKHHVYPEMAAAGLWTTPADLAQYLIYVRRALHSDGEPVLDASIAKEYLAGETGTHGLGPEIYAVGEHARFGHSGIDEGFEAAMVSYVEHGKGVVIMTNANLASMFFDEIKGSVARAYDWPGFPTRPQLVAERISSSLLERAPGRYQLGEGMTGILTAKDGRLFFDGPRGRAEVFAKDATQLFAPTIGSSTFELVEHEGEVVALKSSDGTLLERID